MLSSRFSFLFSAIKIDNVVDGMYFLLVVDEISNLDNNNWHECI